MSDGILRSPAEPQDDRGGSLESRGDGGVPSEPQDDGGVPSESRGDVAGVDDSHRHSALPKRAAESHLLGPKEVRELAERLGVAPTKKLGQNFVIDANTVRKIVRLARVEAGDRVIEIGPGLGSLTLGLTEAGASVTAVEIDRRLAAELSSTVVAMQPGAESRLRVIHTDALDLSADEILRAASRPQDDGVGSRPQDDGAGSLVQSEGAASTASGDEQLPVILREGEAAVAGSPAGSPSALPSMPEVLVANLPYNVSVPILMHLLELIPELQRGLVMVQAEVGHRVAAGPGSKEYGAPSAKAAWYGDWAIAGTVSRRVFWPIPGVDSVLVSYEKSVTALGSEAERQATFALVNAAFAQRRKMLRQALQPVLGDFATTVARLEAAGVDPESRAEQLDIEAYLAIARA